MPCFDHDAGEAIGNALPKKSAEGRRVPVMPNGILYEGEHHAVCVGPPTEVNVLAGQSTKIFCESPKSFERVPPHPESAAIGPRDGIAWKSACLGKRACVPTPAVVELVVVHAGCDEFGAMQRRHHGRHVPGPYLVILVEEEE